MGIIFKDKLLSAKMMKMFHFFKFYLHDMSSQLYDSDIFNPVFKYS